ncbi:MAG: tRNA pseudouridine(38-40) synthase TruA [Lachnospiraceae bacterium]|nr:tRNA pseudouridine(38-40) synthase TruA [Lachnospiraceae bacterium]
MRNFKMLLEYEGTRYQGWQRQESTENTIQGKLEALLSKMCGHKVEVQGSGRTDAGVHARGQVANAHMDTDMTAEEILAYMNRYLPQDIGVLSVEEVSDRFHSRLLAKEKIYCYQVIHSSLPHIFDRRYAYAYPAPLDIEACRKAASFLVGTHDFAAFTSTKKGKKSTVRTIEEIRIEKEKDIIRFYFRGDGFLFHMVRILTGTLLEVGAGKRKPEEMEALLESGRRELAGALAPAVGLTLLEVRY